MKACDGGEADGIGGAESFGRVVATFAAGHGFAEEGHGADSAEGCARAAGRVGDPETAEAVAGAEAIAAVIKMGVHIISLALGGDLPGEDEPVGIVDGDFQAEIVVIVAMEFWRKSGVRHRCKSADCRLGN